MTDIEKVLQDWQREMQEIIDDLTQNGITGIEKNILVGTRIWHVSLQRTEKV